MKTYLIILLTIIVFFNHAGAQEQEQDQKPALKSLLLLEMYERSNKNNLDMKVTKMDEAITKQQIDRVDGEFGTKVDILSGVGIIKGITGDALSSVRNDEYGESVLFKVDVTVPLYTWNRKGHLLDAIKHKQHIDQASYKKAQSEIHYKILETYWGHLLVKTLLDFAQSSKKDIEKILKKKKKNSFRLLMLMEEITAREIELAAKKEVTLKYLNFLIGESSVEFMPKDKWLVRNRYDLKDFSHYWGHVTEHGVNDLQRLSYGIKAKGSLLLAEEKSRYPQFGLMAGLTYASTPKFEEQQSKFAYDPYNGEDWKLALGFTWNLDFGITKSKIGTLRLEKQQLEQKKIFALKGLKVKLFDQWSNSQEKYKRIKHTLKSYKISKKWYRKKVIKFTLGANKAGDERDIADAYKAKAMAFVAYYKSLYDHHLALGKLQTFLNIESN